jgi:hypothetical protein
MERWIPIGCLLALIFPFQRPSAPRKSQTVHSLEAPPWHVSIESYETREIRGWRVLVLRDFVGRQPALARRTLAQLDRQLAEVVRKVPAGAVKKLRTIRIWVEENEPHHPCMTYHPDEGWLRSHAMSPAKARCVEVANARNFLEWTREQPWMVLHELAHGYHHQFLDGGFDNAAVNAAYKHAMDAKLYDSVLRVGGKREKAYAATNAQEYFAETSEAYFGTNDFYPFVRRELKRHDAECFGMLGTLWGQR